MVSQLEEIHSETLLSRNRITGSRVPVGRGLGDGLSVAVTNAKYHPINARNLVSLMFHLHNRKGLEPRLEFKCYVHAAKVLIDEFGGVRSEEAMMEAARKSRHPWGFAFVRRLLNGSR